MPKADEERLRKSSICGTASAFFFVARGWFVLPAGAFCNTKRVERERRVKSTTNHHRARGIRLVTCFHPCARVRRHEGVRALRCVRARTHHRVPAIADCGEPQTRLRCWRNSRPRGGSASTCAHTAPPNLARAPSRSPTWRCCRLPRVCDGGALAFLSPDSSRAPTWLSLRPPILEVA